MSSSGAPRGDSHNFGRRVTVREDVVHKPRTLLWEWLVLARESPLRAALDAAAPGAFDFLPALSFGDVRTPAGGEVERIALAPLPALGDEERRALARITGRAIALFAWLGAADLHWENLALGLDARGRVVFCPLDVEMILDDLALPTATKLLPDADPEIAAVARHAAGARRVLPFLGKPVGAPELLAIASAYHETLARLERHAAAIAAALDGVEGLRDAPIRVLLRGTDEYVRASERPPWPPLLAAETEQLARGDIPYFFRRYGQPGIHWYTDPSLEHTRRLPLRGDVPQLAPLLSLARGLRSPSRASLRAQGLFTVLGAFDHRALDGVHRGEGITVALTKRRLAVTLPDGEELSARRDLRAVVGSLYLPCRCGEVRTPLVPPVTACEP
ncbi:MAG: hypothetical protein KF729_38695 [Sandaracinaceae bacterium]|nr:hypothetical protein [Sandaracinaceae bacterium]